MYSGTGLKIQRACSLILQILRDMICSPVACYRSFGEPTLFTFFRPEGRCSSFSVIVVTRLSTKDCYISERDNIHCPEIWLRTSDTSQRLGVGEPHVDKVIDHG
jgi:hypothetical protein